MLRARLPLDAKAVAAADAALRDRTDPPGRRLDPTSAADAPLRAAWMQAYADAGGAVDAAGSGPRVGSPTLPCAHFIELRYLHCDGSAVKNAQYHVRASGFSADGTLDGNGFVHLAGVPPVGGFTYWFDKDPEPYVPAGPKLAATSAPVQAAASSAVDDVLDWLWGTAQGDFNKDASLGQIAVNTVLGLVPVVDQVLDVRDLVSGLKDIVVFYMEPPDEQQAHEEVLGLSYEAWLWLALFLIALGCIPEVGSAVKGVAKGLIKLLQDAAKKAGDLSPAQLRRIWEELLKVLNHLGVKPGNAHEWLKQIPSKLDGWMDQAALKIKGAMDALGGLMARAERLVGVVGTEKAAQAVERLRRARAALSHAYGRLDAMKRRINQWLKEQFERVLGGKHPVESGGGIDTKAGQEGANVRTQQQAPPPEPTIPPRPRAERVEELALDPAQGGKATAKTRREAEVGLSLEEQGKLTGPIKRDPSGAAEFIDASGQKWDVKGFNSKYAPKGYNTVDALTKIRSEVATGENVIVDTAAMSPEHVSQLKAALTDAGLMKNVLFF